MPLAPRPTTLRLSQTAKPGSFTPMAAHWRAPLAYTSPTVANDCSTPERSTDVERQRDQRYGREQHRDAPDGLDSRGRCRQHGCQQRASAGRRRCGKYGFSGFATLRMTGNHWTLSGSTQVTSAANDATRVEAGTLVITVLWTTPMAASRSIRVQRCNWATAASAHSPSVAPRHSGQVSRCNPAMQHRCRRHHQQRHVAIRSCAARVRFRRVRSAERGPSKRSPVRRASTSDLSSSRARRRSRAASPSPMHSAARCRSAAAARSKASVSWATRRSRNGGVLCGREGEVLTLAVAWSSIRPVVSRLRSVRPASAALFDVTNDLVLDGTLDVADMRRLRCRPLSAVRLRRHADG